MHQTQAQRNTVVITGIGGVGKSQLVSEYLHSHKSEFASIFWIDAGSESLIRQSFERIALQLLRECKKRRIEGLDEALDAFKSASADDQLDRARELVAKWLSYPGNTDWLIVVDGYDDVDNIDIQTYLPTPDVGNVIITSRRPEAGRLGFHLPLDLFSIKDGMMLLFHSSRLMHLAEKVTNGESTSDVRSIGVDRLSDTLRAAAGVVHQLGYLPLAVDQAGAYIHAQQIEIEQYLPRLFSNFKKVSSRKPKANWPYGKTLFTTWEMSLEAIQTRNPAAAKILVLCAFLGTESITLDMFRTLTDYEPSLYSSGPSGKSSIDELADVTWSKYKRGDIASIKDAIAYFDKHSEDSSENLDETLELLFTYSLAARRGTSGISVHPLVLLWAKERLTKAEQIETARDVVVLVSEYNSRRIGVLDGFSEHFLPQILRCYHLMEVYLIDELQGSDDWPLLIAVERLIVDLHNSKDIAAPLWLNTQLTKNRLMRQRSLDLSIVIGHSHPNLAMDMPADIRDMGMARQPLVRAELLMVLHSIKYHNGSVNSKTYRHFRSILKHGSRHPVDQGTNRLEHVKERLEILHNLFKWEVELSASMRFMTPAEKVLELLKRLQRAQESYLLQVMDLMKDSVERWLAGASSKFLIRSLFVSEKG